LIVLVLDKLNVHRIASLYEAFPQRWGQGHCVALPAARQPSAGAKNPIFARRGEKTTSTG
jgi:hypothetical protein